VSVECLPDVAKRSSRIAIAGMAMWLLVAIMPSRSALAQATPPAVLARVGTTSPKERAELYSQLHQQAEILQKQAAVVKTVAKLVGPTVVHIEADVGRNRSLQYGGDGYVEEAGSGVIIHLKGQYYVLTNRHVIKAASPEKIKINLADGRRVRPTKVWEDAETDIAVMAIAAPELIASRLGDSGKMEIGDFVLAVGSPFGLSHSVTYGIISAKGRRDLQLGDSEVKFQDFVQTDAAINPGNSGGPLVNLRGEIIGINTAIASTSGGNDGIGFAIPINMFMVVARQLIERGKVSRALLGVSVDSAFGPAMAAEIGLFRPVGARITGITPHSPAELAKLQVNDVILQFEQTPVEDASHLVNLVGLSEVGKVVSLMVFREGKQITVQVEVGDPSKF